MMNTLYKISIPAIVAFSFILLLNTAGGSNIYGQLIGNTSQTNQTNLTNQTTSPQPQNQTIITNQTSNNQKTPHQYEKTQSKNITAISEKLFNFTNSAIIALDHKDTATVKYNLAQLQNALINATGKQVVLIPSDAMSSK